MKSKLIATNLQKKIITKTASTVLMHSYRSSNFSQNLPINYNDGLVSMRSNFATNELKSKRLLIIKTQPHQKNVIGSCQKGKIKKINMEKANVAKKQNEPKINLSRHSQMSSFYNQKGKNPYSVYKKTNLSSKKYDLDQFQMNNIQRRAREVLNKYKRYTQNLQKQVKNYKFKYYSTIKILKKVTKFKYDI